MDVHLHYPFLHELCIDIRFSVQVAKDKYYSELSSFNDKDNKST